MRWGALGIFVTLALVELIVRAGLISSDYFPPPTEIFGPLFSRP